MFLYLYDSCMFQTGMLAISKRFMCTPYRYVSFISMIYVYSIQICLLYLYVSCIFHTDMLALSIWFMYTPYEYVYFVYKIYVYPYRYMLALSKWFMYTPYKYVCFIRLCILHTDMLALSK